MITSKLTGMGVALITPFNGDETVDFAALARVTEHLIKNNADYIVVCGTTAETPTLTETEKREIAAFVINTVAGRCPVVLGVGGNNTKAVVEHLKNDDFTGADAILSITPYYNKPSQEGLYRHFAEIAKASPLPVILYNVPGRTGINMTAATTIRLANDFENICAIKEASGNFTQIDDIIKNKPADFMVISGDDGITFPLVTLGAVGVISVIGNAFPREFGKMVRLALQGDYDNARSIHHRFTELFDLLFVEGNPAGVKSMLAVMGFINNVLRLPLVPNTIKTYEKIRVVLNQLV
jgi:4-hydroxy-tetrahydrodipicolinate synthase